MPSTGPRPLSPMRLQRQGTWSRSTATSSLATKPAIHCQAAFRTRTSVSSSLSKSQSIAILCRFECWRTACRQLLSGEIGAANATLWSVFSGVAAHVVLPTRYVHFSGQGATGSLECACASSLKHSALSPSVTPSLSPSRWTAKCRCLPETVPANCLNPRSNLMRQVMLRKRRIQQYGHLDSQV